MFHGKWMRWGSEKKLSLRYLVGNESISYLGKRNIIFKTTFGRGYVVSSQESKLLWQSFKSLSCLAVWFRHFRLWSYEFYPHKNNGIDWCIQCIQRLQREHGKTSSDFCRCNGVLVHPKMDSNNWRLFTASTLPCLLALKKRVWFIFFGFPPNQRGWSQQVFSAWLSPLVSTNRGERCNCLSVGSHKLQVEHCRTGLAIGSNGVGRAQKFKRIKVAVVFCHQEWVVETPASLHLGCIILIILLLFSLQSLTGFEGLAARCMNIACMLFRPWASNHSKNLTRKASIFQTFYSNPPKKIVSPKTGK